MTVDTAQVPVSTIRDELSSLPAGVLSNFDSAYEAISGKLPDDKLLEWANVGRAVARRTVRSWEAASELFSASPAVQRHLPAGQFVNWAKTGDSLCSDAPSLSVSFFRASPRAVERLRPRYIGDWAQACKSLYRGTWKSSALASKLFESTPDLLVPLSFEEFRRHSEFLCELSRRSYDMAGEALASSLELYPLLGKDSGAFIGLANTVATNTWRHSPKLFQAARSTIVDLPSSHRVSLLALVSRLARSSSTDAPTVMRDGARAMSLVDAENRDALIDLAHRAAGLDAKASAAFLATVPQVMERVTFPQIVQWHQHGIDQGADNGETAVAYFRNESATSHARLDALSSSVELDRVREIIRMYCRMLAGREIEVQASQQLVNKKIGWFQGELPTTEGTTIYLPKVINRHPAKDLNFGFFKVIATHQTGHIEFGSFIFSFERPSTMFTDVRPELRNGSVVSDVTDGEDAKVDIDGDQVAATDADKSGQANVPMSRFFDLFPDRKVALDVFTIFESTRIDSNVTRSYRGLAVLYGQVQEEALDTRPEMTELPAREALVELMIRASLGQWSELAAPSEHLETAKRLRALVDRMRSEGALVEDSAEATIRACALLAEVANEMHDPDEFEDLDDDEEDDPTTAEEVEDVQGLIEMFVKSMMPGEGVDDDDVGGESDSEDDSSEVENGEMDYSSPHDVDYRGEFKPELSQLLSQAQLIEAGEFGDEVGDMTPLTQEQLEELMKNSAELDMDSQEGEGGDDEVSPELAEMLENLLKEMQRRDPQSQAQPSGPMQHVDEDGGPLIPQSADQFVYDEWDFRANEYKPAWCMVHEKPMNGGDEQFYRDTLVDKAAIVHMIKKHFELVMPEMYRKQKRLEDGEELDLDQTLEALIDIRAGVTPDEKLYWRRNKTERSVAVAFLLDMSASTAEAIEDAKRPNDEWGAPDDPVEYMVWLRSRRSEGNRKSYKRIVDVEKEGVVLLINALENLGDDYGIYGFSGYGRENVEFYVIKEMDEKFSVEIPRRIDRIAPLHATRMGPSIRHATTKLANQESRSKFLFMISDGRPQDRGYSREGVEKEYAVHDTRMAFHEARQQGVVPFCLTVDKQGHDYLKVMMDDFNYEVLPDVSLLPQRLLMLYRRLTM